MKAYWQSRKHLGYYKVVLALARVFGRNARSVIDVGCADCEYVLELEWIPHKTAIDPYKLPESDEMEKIQADFLAYDFSRHFDMVLNLQVLEHLDEPAAFSQKLLSIGDVVIISVPYKWPVGRSEWHVQDPIDEAKVVSWVGAAPRYSCVSDERLICVYTQSPVGVAATLRMLCFRLKWAPLLAWQNNKFQCRSRLAAVKRTIKGILKLGN